MDCGNAMAGEAPNDQTPPPVRRSARKTLLVVGCGVVLALLLLVVVMNLDRSRPTAPKEETPTDEIDIAAPDRLTEEEQRADRPAGRDLAEIGSLSGAGSKSPTRKAGSPSSTASIILIPTPRAWARAGSA